MAKKTFDLNTATRKELVAKIGNLRLEVNSLSGAIRRSSEEWCRLDQKLNHWRKTMKGLIQ